MPARSDSRTLDKRRLFGNKEFRLNDTDIFSNLKHLVSLKLEYSFIESLNQRLFSQLTKLECLSICSNQIEGIEENTFSNLKNLHTLSFNFNYLSKLNGKSFIGFDRLKFFGFNLNKLNDSYISVKDKFGYMTNGKRIID